MARIAVIGTGRIGLPVVTNLVRAGHLVCAFDVRAELRPAVLAAGGRWASSAAGAAESAGTLFTVLPGSPELRLLMLGEQPGAGLLTHLAPQTVWVDLTSAAPDLDEELARAAAAHHIRRLDAGVGGGVEAAERAALTLYVGGDHGLFERVRPQLRAFADPARTHYVGGDGAGHLTKLLVNLLWFGQAVATGEALLLAQRAGLDLGRLTAVLPVSAAASEYLTSALPRLLDGNYLTSFGLPRCVEELDSIERLAKRERVPFELSAQVARIHREALAALGPVDGELMAVAYLEQLAGSLIRDRATST